MADYILDKGFPVLSTYNTSDSAGVTAYRCVTLNSSAQIDLNATATTASTGVVQENIDAAKVALGKTTANVRLIGVTYVRASDTPGSIVVGSKVAASGTSGNKGGVKLAVSTNVPLGIVIGMAGATAVAAGDLLTVLLTPGMPALP